MLMRSFQMMLGEFNDIIHTPNTWVEITHFDKHETLNMSYFAKKKEKKREVAGVMVERQIVMED